MHSPPQSQPATSATARLFSTPQPAGRRLIVSAVPTSLEAVLSPQLLPRQRTMERHEPPAIARAVADDGSVIDDSMQLSVVSQDVPIASDSADGMQLSQDMPRASESVNRTPSATHVDVFTESLLASPRNVASEGGSCCGQLAMGAGLTNVHVQQQQRQQQQPPAGTCTPTGFLTPQPVHARRAALAFGKQASSQAFSQQQQQLQQHHGQPLHSTGALLKRRVRGDAHAGRRSLGGVALSSSSSSTSAAPETPSKRALQFLPFSSPMDPTLLLPRSALMGGYRDTTDTVSFSSEGSIVARSDHDSEYAGDERGAASSSFDFGVLGETVRKHKAQHEDLFLETPSKPVSTSSLLSSSLCVDSPEAGAIAHVMSDTASLTSPYGAAARRRHHGQAPRDGSFSLPLPVRQHPPVAHAEPLIEAPLDGPFSPVRSHHPAGSTRRQLPRSPRQRSTSGASVAPPFSPLRHVAWMPDGGADADNSAATHSHRRRPIPRSPISHAAVRSLLGGDMDGERGGVRSSSSLLELFHQCTNSPGREGSSADDAAVGTGDHSDVSMLMEDDDNQDENGAERANVADCHRPRRESRTSTSTDEDDAFRLMASPNALPPPPSIIWNTPFVHFLDRAYFEKFHCSSGYVLPKPPTDASDWFHNHFERHFLIAARIGSGSFAEVFRAQDKMTGVDYAVKRTKHAFVGYKDRLKTLEEVEILWRLGAHRHVIDVVQAWEQHGYLYIQTDFYELGSLERYLEDPSNVALQESDIWNAIVDLVLGLKHIHDLDIVHLDLKPSNIFIANDHALLIGDFGLAASTTKPIDDREGDRNYMAPEILEGRYGKPADIFSLGLVILEMTANVALPECGPAYHKLRRGDLSDVPFDPTATSSTLVQLIEAMLAAEPDLRPTVDQLLFHPRIAAVVFERMESEGLLGDGGAEQWRAGGGDDLQTDQADSARFIVDDQ